MDNSQRIATTVGIIMAAVMLCSGALLIGYIHGRNNGYQSGYEVGQSVTATTQQNTPWETESYQAGYQKGRESGLKEASSYDLHNPSYQEMMDFLSEDTTNSIPYVPNEYMCTDYAAQVNNNAEAKGIRCAIVYILNKENVGHTIVAFQTTDRGLQFVEPQYDRVVKLVIGQSYSELNNFSPQPNDDTIERYLIIW
jgi:uncharacterized protein YxeA